MKSHANKEQRVEEARNLEREETRGSDERVKIRHVLTSVITEEPFL